MNRRSKRSSTKTNWLLGAALLAVGCKSEVEQPAVDPVDDPWVDAIPGDEEPMALATPEPGAEVVPAAVDTTDAEASPDAPVPADDQGTTDDNAAAPAKAGPGASTSSTSPSAPSDPTPTPTAAVGEEPPAPEPAAPVAAPTAEPTPASKPAEPTAPPPITVADFDGNYRFVGGDGQRDELKDAIEATVQQLSAAIHGIARRRLTDANPADTTVDITVAGDKVTTTFASGFTVTCEIDGPAVTTKGIGGERLDVKLRAKGSKLVQHLQGRDGARTIVYVLSADRKKLTVHHKITADRLPEPLTYRLSYSRK